MELINSLERHWLRWLTALWAATAAFLVIKRWNMIRWFALPDTDDNMRMSQVRALLNGQGWYDLRQYKLNPPHGFDIHWTRIVDLPIAALELMARLFTDSFTAEKFAAAVAPMLPLWVAFLGLALVVRRLIAPGAFFLAVALILCCSASLQMYMPLRVDHHGWQLAMLTLTLAGLVDADKKRGGLLMGASSAVSLSIGLELMPFLAISGAAVALRWMWDHDEAARLRTYALSLALGCTLGYLGFASYANSVPRCDVLSPVWLAVMVAAGGMAFGVSFVRLEGTANRIILLAIVGVILGLFFRTSFPQCMGRPEQITDELYRDWFSHISEARPLYVQSWATIASVVTLPVIGVLTSLWALWRAHRQGQFGNWAPVTLVAIVSLALVFWQSREGPAAQLLAVPGVAAVLWHFTPALRAHRSVLVRTLGVVALFLVMSGLAVGLFVEKLPGDHKKVASAKSPKDTSAYCQTMPALAPIAKLPATTIFTLVDMGPRLITVTWHKAIAGPYHRNGAAILDVQYAFEGTPDTARTIIARHGATLLLICPGMNEAGIYTSRAKNGFYARIDRGEAFDWLDVVALPKGSPFKLWRVNPEAARP